MLYALVIFVIAFVIGILIGRYATCPQQEEKQTSLPAMNDAIIKEADSEIGDDIINQISSENIRLYLRDLSELPHLAGTPADYTQAKELVDFWSSVGLDETFLTPYDVLLSYPNNDDESQMNRLFVYDDNGQTVWQSDLREPILHPSENKSDVVPPFNAYSAPGDIRSAELIYVNYARAEDFYWLMHNKSIDVTGKIVLARYGKIFRGDKVAQAERYGARGIIIYSDPADYDDSDTSHVYPDDWWLPDSGVQRGTVFLGKGDPLTPGYPAIETAFRLNQSDPSIETPNIPVHPIGYGIAWNLFGYMTGDEVPSEWRGGLNRTYRFGGNLSVSGQSGTIRMRISTSNAVRRTYNAIGIIRGAYEPDRYIILGNHRDAWVFGAIDPSSGTAVMKEISRVMGNMVKSGKWRPRRSIIFCSWGSEEYGLIGSTEWIEQYIKSLAARSVGYLNVDISVQGNFSLRALATPLLYEAIYSATRRVPNPDPLESSNVKTVYDKWLSSFPNADSSKPRISSMGSGSDYASFIQQVGLPCLDVRYTYDNNKYKVSSYPLYHSKYETFYAVDNIIDRGFRFHTAVGQTWAEIARNLADSLIIPFNVMDYAIALESLVDQLFADYGPKMESNGIRFGKCTEKLNQFKVYCQSATPVAHGVVIRIACKQLPYAIREINDKLMNLERAFIDPSGLPGRPLARHVLFAESSVNTYAGSSFPGLVDGMFEIDEAPDKVQRWEKVKQHYSVILFTIQSASSTVKDSTRFM
ncbi:hypothetical protein FSP39_003224 [Pinctada imbricata]|uniref:glutamate carboxypeptidase II n=1 Tax=Pinctada imbricata TaxID=66713 RepID=A0AA89BYK4_PINIB|nr:hypothetical protein FSP39_003224 [Pinctada imbricata]